MPNTLVHIGAQTLLSKTFFRDADSRYIALACIVPDLPWIVQRIVLAIGLKIDIYNLLLYCLIQATLLFCLLLSGVISLYSNKSVSIFLLLGFNCFLHLLLDALQIKMANGVHFLAPFSWTMVGFNLFWPEHFLTYVFSGLGAFLLLYFGVKEMKNEISLVISRSRLLFGAGLLIIYLVLPVFLFNGPLAADNHFLATLKNSDTRTGKVIEFDRCQFNAKGSFIRAVTGEKLQVSGALPERDSLLSLSGFFIDNRTIYVNRYHVHSAFRDIASIMGLGGVLFVWLTLIWRKKLRIVSS